MVLDNTEVELPTWPAGAGEGFLGEVMPEGLVRAIH